MTTRPQAPAGRILPGRRWAIMLGLVVLAALVVRLDVLHNRAPEVPAFGDAHAYHVLGANLAAGRGYIRPYEWERQGQVIATAEYPPGLPVLLAAADKLGVSSVDEQRALLAVVGAATVGLVGLLGRRLGGERVGLLAALLVALHPSLLAADATLMAETLAAFGGVALVLAAVAVHDRPTLARWAFLGALTGLGAMVRAELIVTGVLLLVALAVTVRVPRRPRVRGLAVGLAVFVLVLAPWTVRNGATFHRFVPVSNNLGSVARGANCDLAYNGRFRGLWVTNVGEVGGDQVDPRGRCFSGFGITDDQNEAERASVLRSEGLSYARDHGGEVPGVVLARLGRTVGLYRFDQQANFSGAEGRDVQLDRLGTRLFQLLAIVVLLGTPLLIARRGPTLLLLAPVVAVLVTVAATYGSLRFRTVADPAVALLAMLVLADLVRGAMRYRRAPCP